MKAMLIGGINDKKAEKLIKLVHDNCGKDIEVVNVNTFTQDVAEEVAKENPDVLVLLSKAKYDFDVPQVDGLGLMYPQMGLKKTVDALKAALGL